jgi:membrane-associated phospholipid phosphatase
VREHPWRVLAASALLLAPLYGLASRPSFFRPYVIAAGAIDARVPLVPAAVIPYLTYFLLLPALVLGTRRLAAFPRVFLAALACWTVNVALYFVCPTRLASRPAAPAGTLLAILQRFDTPLCALPSGHVALPMAIAVAALLAARGGASARAWRRTAAVFFAWTLLLAASAWLTGQHYLVDLLAGFALGAVVALVTLAVTVERVTITSVT